MLFEFLGIPDPALPAGRMDPEARQRQLFAVIKRLIHSRSQGTPAVLVFEDLHWIDGASEAALENLIDLVPFTRTLLLVNFRPEYHADWMQKPYYQQLPLLPLGGEAIQQLLNEILGDDPSLVDLTELIRERTGGNPFFLEEVVQSLLDHGGLSRDVPAHAWGRARLHATRPVTEIDIPPTVQAVLAARIDRLPEPEKQVLQAAAVIGKEFTDPVLRRALETQPAGPLLGPELDTVLEALTKAELICQRALYPESEYAFKHPLTQEVAYRSQFAERRAPVHATVARGFYALLGLYSGEREGVLAHAQQAVEIAENIGSPMSRGQAYEMLGIAHVLREEWDEAIAALRQELKVSRERHTGLLAEAGSLAILAGAYLGHGDLELARSTAEEALAVARQHGSRLFECDAQIVMARVLMRTEGSKAKAAIESALAQAQALVEETGARVRQPLIHIERAELASIGGEKNAWRGELQRALQLFTEMGASGHARRIHERLE